MLNCGRSASPGSEGGTPTLPIWLEMIVGVHPLAGFDKLLHYRVPENLRATIAVGSLVRVPVLNALKLGIVGEIGAPKDFPLDRLKLVAQVARTWGCSRSWAGGKVVWAVLIPSASTTGDRPAGWRVGP